MDRMKKVTPRKTATPVMMWMKCSISLAMGVLPVSRPEVSVAMRPITVRSPVHTTMPRAVPVQQEVEHVTQTWLRRSYISDYFPGSQLNQLPTWAQFALCVKVLCILSMCLYVLFLKVLWFPFLSQKHGSEQMWTGWDIKPLDVNVSAISLHCNKLASCPVILG